MNHVTRMTTESRICVAGIERGARRHVRPVTPRTQLLTRRLLRSNGGPFGPGAVVDVGAARHDPNPPETEDHWVNRDALRYVGDLDGSDYWELLSDVSVASLDEAFEGAVTEIRPGKFAVAAGDGSSSLGVVALAEPELHIRFGNLYLHADAGRGEARLRVTDVRFYEPDHSTVKRNVVMDVNQRLARGERALTMVGLARAMRDEQSGLQLHWAQVNGLCLADDPVSDAP